MSIFELMAAPFAECMILVGIHTYLGIHVLRRRVIFVDLALAQTAALGTTVGFLFGLMPESPASLIFSITFTFLAAGVFALTRIRSEKVPQEAVIGLFYAIAAAVAVLVVEKTKGAEHMESILVGGLLWVRWTDVALAAAAYSFIGVIHWVFRKQFRMISERPDEAYESGMNVRVWDFLFYLTFGLVISFSVRVAGVLLVFVFLVAPAIMAFLITNRMRYQLLIGWISGTIVTAGGLYLSYAMDLPSGPTVIASYGLILVFGALVVFIVGSARKRSSILKVAAGIGVATIVALLVWTEGHLLSESSLAGNSDHEPAPLGSTAQAELPGHVSPVGLDREREDSKALASLRAVSGELVSDDTLMEYLEAEDSEARLGLLSSKVRANPKAGLPLVLCFLSDPDSGDFFKSEALDLVKETLGDDFGFDPGKDKSENLDALERMKGAIKAM